MLNTQQYPNVVPLQAIVGQGAATAPATEQGSAVVAPGAPAAAPAAGDSGSVASALNPMGWMAASGGDTTAATAPAPAPVADPTAPETSADV